MIDLLPDLAAAFAAQTNQPVDLYELQLDSGTYYYSDQDITWNGKHYLPYVMTRSDVKRYMSEQFDQVTVTFSNVDLTLAQLIAVNDVEGGILTIRKIDRTVTDDSLPLFIGQIQRPGNVDENVCEIVALEYLGSIDSDIPARLFGATCPWPFRGPECTYSGTATDCDHSWSNCASLANTDKFGGFRFMPVTGTYQYKEVTQSRFLLFFSRKKTSTITVSYSSLDDTPYDVPIPIVLGRALLQGIPLEHADEDSMTFGPYLAALVAFCVGPIGWFEFFTANNVTITGVEGHLGDLGGTGSQLPDTILPSYPYSLLAYLGVAIPSTVGADDPAPSVTAMIGGLLVDQFDGTGAWVVKTWTDNAIWNARALMTLPLAEGGMGIPWDFFDDVQNYVESAYTDEFIEDPTNCQKIYAPTSLPTGMTIGDNYRAYRSTCVQFQDPTADGPYATFVVGVDDDTSRAPDIVNVKRFTVNLAIAQQASSIDLLYQTILPAFRGYLKINKQGKIQICSERANPHTAVSTASVPGAMQILCADPSQFGVGDLFIASTFTINAEVLRVAVVLSDRLTLAAAATKNHAIGDELLKVSMYFNDSNIVGTTPVQYPLSDRQSSINRVNVKYPDSPAVTQRTLYVNDFDNQAKVRKVNDQDFDGSAIDSYFQAWRVGQWQLAMYRGQGIFVSLRGDISASAIEIADVIAVDAVEHGLQAVPFRAIELGFTADDEVDIVGQLYDTGLYDDTAPQVTVTVPAVFSGPTPPTPISGIKSAGGGTVTWKPVTFASITGTSQITSAVIVVLYQDATASPTAHLTAALANTAVSGAAETIHLDADMTGIIRNGDWILAGGEMMFVTADATSADVAVERALGLTAAENHAIGDGIYKLVSAAFTYTFPLNFFATADAASWGATEQLQNANIALFNVVVYAGSAVSNQDPINYSQSVGGLIPTGVSAGSSFLPHFTAAVVDAAAGLDFTVARTMKVTLTEHTRISAINTSGLGAFLWVMTVSQDGVGGHAMIPGDGLTFALSTEQSPPNTQVTAMIYYDGAGNHILLSSTGDQPIP